jgi:dienelactone hydrolase
MRFPDAAGAIASVSVTVTSLAGTMDFWRGVLHPLGYGRVHLWPGHVLWARDGAQLLVGEGAEPARGVTLTLRAAARAQVDAIWAAAEAADWPREEAPREQPFAPGYYGCVLRVPDAPGIRVAIAHAFDDLPEHEGARRVRIAGADPDVEIGGYLFEPERSTERAVILVHGYTGDARFTAWLGARMRDAGWMALCISQRGWLGSTGDEDQGFRQPDDLFALADWLARERGAARIALVGFSQGAQVVLLAAARADRFAATVAFCPCTDLDLWRQQTGNPALEAYLEDFVPPERRIACSPVHSAQRIAAPVLLVHGDADTLVPIAQSEVMVAANPAIRLHRVPGAGHDFQPRFEEGWNAAMDFLRPHLDG